MVEGLGTIVVLNGAPRSGKSGIASAIQDSFDGVWMNLGVDVFSRHVTPPRYRPGIGLRPGGGERPDLEALIPRLYAALYDSVVAHSRQGLNVVVDVGHHDVYDVPMRPPLRDAAERLQGFPALLVGVRCPIETILERRAVEQPGRAGQYEQRSGDGSVPGVVALWQEAVHRPGVYDLEVDTSTATSAECAELIRDHLARGPVPSALARLARRGDEPGPGEPAGDAEA